LCAGLSRALPGVTRYRAAGGHNERRTFRRRAMSTSPRDAQTPHTGKVVNDRNKLVVSYGSYSDKVDARKAAISGIALQHILSKRTSIWLSGGKVDNKTGQQILPYAQGYLYGFTDKPGRDSSAYSMNIVHRF
jgi:hypothetical protein